MEESGYRLTLSMNRLFFFVTSGLQRLSRGNTSASVVTDRNEESNQNSHKDNNCPVIHESEFHVLISSRHLLNLFREFERSVEGAHVLETLEGAR